MRLFLLFTLLVSAAYTSTFFITHDIGTATNAGGIGALAYLIVVIVKATRPPFPKKQRLLVIIIAAISISGIATAWISMYRTTHWQRSMLLTLRNVIIQGVMQDTLMKRGLLTLEAYHRPNRSIAETFADVFHRLNPTVGDDPSTLDTLFDDPIKKSGIMERIYIESVTDSILVLVGEDLTAFRQDSIFRVLKMNVAKQPRAKLQLTPKGATYELEK